MRKIKLLSIVSVAILATTFTACVPDTGLTPPTISVTVDGTPTYAPGSTVTYKVVMGTNNGDLKTLSATASGSYQPASGSGITGTTNPTGKWDATKNEFTNGTSSVTALYDIVIGSNLKNGDQIFLKFEVTDEKLEAATEEVTLTVGGGGGGNTGIDMTNEVSGTNYSFLASSAYPSGWDMINDQAASYSTSKANIDIYNKTNAFDANWNNTYGFTPAFWTLQGTKLVKTSISYDTSKLQDVMDAYNAGSKLDTEIVTSTGETFVAQLRGGNTYAIIKVTNIGYTSNNKNDFISFKYKKATK